MTFDEAISKIPSGMIWRLETAKVPGMYLFMFGKPSEKGNFKGNKYTGYANTPAKSILMALER